MSYIISVTNQKGGVGKTTTSVNLATALARADKKVLLVDFDPQGHTSEHIGSKPKGNTPSILELLLGQQTIEQVIQATYIPNLSLIGANLRLGKFNQLAPKGNQFVMKNSISKQAHDYFDYIILDCQPSLSLLTLNALTSSDGVLLPVQAEFLALDGLTQLIVTLKDVQTQLHPKLRILGILLTMYDSRNRLSTEVYNELSKNFGDDVFRTIIPRNIKLAEAPSFNKSIFDYDPYSSGAKAYHDLSLEVIHKVRTEEMRK